MGWGLKLPQARPRGLEYPARHTGAAVSCQLGGCGRLCTYMAILRNRCRSISRSLKVLTNSRDTETLAQVPKSCSGPGSISGRHHVGISADLHGRQRAAGAAPYKLITRDTHCLAATASLTSPRSIHKRPLCALGSVYRLLSSAVHHTFLSSLYLL